MFTNNKRIAVLLAVSSAMNFTLFCISYFLKLPLWLDTTGTIYIACILGTPEGFLVSIINNVLEASFFYGEKSLVFYFVSLITAFIAGFLTKKFNSDKFKKWVLMIFALILTQCLFSVIFTFIATNGIPSNYWSYRLYSSFNNIGFQKNVSSILSVVTIKCIDVLVTVGIVAFAIFLTPSKYKTSKESIMNSVEEIL